MSSNATEWEELAVAFGLLCGVILLLAFVKFILSLRTQRYSSTTSSQRFIPSFRLHTINVVAGGPNYNSPQLGVDEATLKTFPVLLYSEAKRHQEGDSAATCSICLTDFNNSEWMKELPRCGHLFHRKCIDVWFRMNSSCPLCQKSSLPTPLSTPMAEVPPLAVLSGAYL